MRWMTSRLILFLLVAVNLVSIGAAEIQRRALMKSLYSAQAIYTKQLDEKIERFNDQIGSKISKLEGLAQAIAASSDAPSETLARVQKIQTDLERATTQLVDIQGNARSSQTVAQEQRSVLPEITARLNHVELLIQQIQAQLAELPAKTSHTDTTPSR
ncbi:UNVERIFIED_ORG: chromosome segregation ATPase [Bradyrhizobium japonicum]|jgi:chromosome segregation ATPase|uniref:hypothetical protein n=1 Tax=Bradyrhizobium TaxID=374 RepID=UPI0034862FB3